MKKLFLIIIANTCLLSCAQKKENNQPTTINNSKNMYDINQYIFPEAKDITETNFVAKVSSQIKHYDKEPMYYVRINKENCLIEVYINDVFNNSDYELSNVITPIGIYPVLKSGSQKVTVKMYPVGDLINKDLGLENQVPTTKLSDKAKVDISVVMMDNKSKKSFDDEKVITTQVSPKEAAGKEFYEFSFTFNAEVPYEFEGWTKGQDLRKLDQDLVRKKALEFYKMIGQIHVNNDINAELKLVYPSTARIQQVLYKDNNINNILEEYRGYVIDNYKQLPITTYKMDYMGDGKLLCLITDSLDPKLRGGGALMLEYGEDKSIYQPGITLYLPEGRDLATQGFMMWK